VVLFPRLVFSAPTGSLLLLLPLFSAVTFTVTVQEPLAGIEPPPTVSHVAPLVAVSVPPQVVLALGVEAINMPLGKLSVSKFMLATIALGLFKIMVRVETPPFLIVLGLNDLLSVGAVGLMTIKVAEAAVVLLPKLVCSAPTGSVLT